MTFIYTIKEFKNRLMSLLSDGIRIIAGRRPATVAQSTASEEVVDVPIPHPDTDSDRPQERRLSSNQRGRYGRH